MSRGQFHYYGTRNRKKSGIRVLCPYELECNKYLFVRSRDIPSSGNRLSEVSGDELQTRGETLSVSFHVTSNLH